MENNYLKYNTYVFRFEDKIMKLHVFSKNSLINFIRICSKLYLTSIKIILVNRQRTLAVACVASSLRRVPISI